jgi:rhodanese-related sulfurtransferase
MKTITPNQLQRLLETNPETMVFDVRTPVEYAEAHVPAGVNEPLHRFEPDKLIASGAIPQGKPVYLLCQSGARALKAAEKLAAAGHEGGGGG